MPVEVESVVDSGGPSSVFEVSPEPDASSPPVNHGSMSNEPPSSPDRSSSLEISSVSNSLVDPPRPTERRPASDLPPAQYGHRARSPDDLHSANNRRRTVPPRDGRRTGTESRRMQSEPAEAGPSAPIVRDVYSGRRSTAPRQQYPVYTSVPQAQPMPLQGGYYGPSTAFSTYSYPIPPVPPPTVPIGPAPLPIRPSSPPKAPADVAPGAALGKSPERRGVNKQGSRSSKRRSESMLRKELQKLEAEIAQRDQAELTRQLHEEETKRAMEEELKRVQEAAEDAAWQRLQNKHEADEARRRAEAEIRAERKRTQEEDAAIVEAERATVAKLKEEDAKAQEKRQLEKFELETRTKMMAEIQAEAQEESRKRWAAQLEARERTLFEAEAALQAREMAVGEAEIKNKVTREFIVNEMAALRTAATEAEARNQDALEPAAGWGHAKTVSEGNSVAGADADAAQSPYFRAFLEDATLFVPFEQSPFLSRERDQTQESGSDSSSGHSTQGQESVPCAQPGEQWQSKSPINGMPVAGAPGARVPFDIDAVYSSTITKNITVHLNLDLSQDIDDELEEFVRLSRIGNFEAAESCFEQHLRSHLNNPIVFVLYADMLLEKGDFKALISLDDSSVFARSVSAEPEEFPFEFDQLEMNWKLIRAIMLCHTQHKIRFVREAFKGLDPFWGTPPIGSTELRNLILAMRLTKLATRPPETRASDRSDPSDWADWRGIYRHLLSEDRIWDFRDAFVAFSASYGTKRALDAFLDHVGASPVEGLLQDWQTDLHDESTELALLDLLSFMALETGTSPDARHLSQDCLQLAEPIGVALLDNAPHTIRSRVFVQWVIAKSVAESDAGRKFKYLADYRGHTVFPRFEPGMPYYIPIQQEDPGWHPPDLLPEARQSLHMALETSREIHDYRTEARCLQELALRAQNPTGHLQELAELQRARQLDMAGYLATCLTRYLTCGDAQTKHALLQDLHSFGSWGKPSHLVDPTAAAARDVLLRALSLGSEGDARGRSMEAALEYHYYLPGSFQRTIDSNVPRGSPGSNGEEDWTTPFFETEEPYGEDNSEEEEEDKHGDDEAIRVEDYLEEDSKRPSTAFRRNSV